MIDKDADFYLGRTATEPHMALTTSIDLGDVVALEWVIDRINFARLPPLIQARIVMTIGEHSLVDGVFDDDGVGGVVRIKVRPTVRRMFNKAKAASEAMA